MKLASCPVRAQVVREGGRGSHREEPIMTATITETLPAIACTPWCENGKGHTDAWHPDDQVCFGTRHIVRFTREALLHDGDHERRLDTLEFYLAREAEGPVCPPRPQRAGRHRTDVDRGARAPRPPDRGSHGCGAVVMSAGQIHPARAYLSDLPAASTGRLRPGRGGSLVALPVALRVAGNARQRGRGCVRGWI
jgi:hypothetical protein